MHLCDTCQIVLMYDDYYTEQAATVAAKEAAARALKAMRGFGKDYYLLAVIADNTKQYFILDHPTHSSRFSVEEMTTWRDENLM